MTKRSERRQFLERRLAHLKARYGGSYDAQEASALRWILDQEEALTAERDQARAVAKAWRDCYLERHLDPPDDCEYDSLPWEDPHAG